jgi:hypothetical protein
MRIALCGFCGCMAKQSLHCIEVLPVVHQCTRKRMSQVVQPTAMASLFRTMYRGFPDFDSGTNSVDVSGSKCSQRASVISLRRVPVSNRSRIVWPQLGFRPCRDFNMSWALKLAIRNRRTSARTSHLLRVSLPVLSDF